MIRAVVNKTDIRCRGRFVYLATVMDLFIREVVGFNLSRFHNRFDTDGEPLEELYQMIYYYNQKRIHSKLKMPPAQYRQKYQNGLKEGMESMP